MADHFSGPRALSDPAADLTDVYTFPSPDRPGRLVLVANVMPLATETTLFSDAVTYRFRVRPISGAVDRPSPAFALEEAEFRFDCTFGSPRTTEGVEGAAQAGTCRTPDGGMFTFQVGAETPSEAHGVRVFAGPRLDPFFIDVVAHLATEEREALAFRRNAPNALDGLNCLSIILEVDVTTVSAPTPARFWRSLPRR